MCVTEIAQWLLRLYDPWEENNKGSDFFKKVNFNILRLPGSWLIYTTLKTKKYYLYNWGEGLLSL